MFYSLSVTWGGLIMFGSYNKFDHKVHIDAMVISSLDFITSLIASVAVFSILGSMARSGGVEVSDVVKSGQNLAFIAFPEAIGRVPGWQLWSVLFFIMLYTLGLDSQVSGITLFLDERQKMVRGDLYHQQRGKNNPPQTHRENSYEWRWKFV